MPASPGPRPASDELAELRSEHRRYDQNREAAECEGCGWEWPCTMIRLIDRIAELEAENFELRVRLSGMRSGESSGDEPPAPRAGRG